MRVTSLQISNFRGIELVELSKLGRLVVLVGTNGSGKSSVLDALRFAKSCYGSYHPQQNELDQFCSEFQIRSPDVQERRLVRDSSKRLEISFVIELSDRERAFLHDNALSLLHHQTVERQRSPMPARQSAMTTLVHHGAKIDREARGKVDRFNTQLNQPLTARITVRNGTFDLEANSVLSLIFSMYQPREVGVFDFHGPHRVFNREGEVEAFKDGRAEQYRQHALYNYSGKYSNVRAELSATYVRELMRRSETGAILEAGGTTRTFRQLFATFFPHKTFVGPSVSAEGRLNFPISSNGLEHDIDDMSSGEKEVVLGYVRLLELGLKDSVILIDEPELHLNPAITQQLPTFYRDTLIANSANQVWLATHCERLVRKAVVLEDTTVIGFEPPAKDRVQALVVAAGDALETNLANIVGITYRPSRPVVLLEGEGDEFDKDMITTLFPDFANKFNFASVGSKDRVRKQLSLLQEIAASSGLTEAPVRAIVDRDLVSSEQMAMMFTWEVFHIENHLLEPRFILKVFQDGMRDKSPFGTEGDVETAMRGIAEELLLDFVREEMENHSNDRLRALLAHNIDRNNSSVAGALRNVVEEVGERIRGAIANELSLAKLTTLEKQIRDELASALAGDEWRSKFRGREILKQLNTRYHKGKYQMLRNLILAAMRDAQFRPPAMERVLSQLNALPS